MNKTASIVIAIILIIGGIWYLSSRKTSPTSMVRQEVESTVVTQVPTSQEPTNTKTFTVEGGNFKFTPNAITVSKGDTVKIIFKNMEGFHDLVIDEFNVKTKQISADQEETVEFVADKTGTFEFYCSVGSHRKMGMVGTLEVK